MSAEPQRSVKDLQEELLHFLAPPEGGAGFSSLPPLPRRGSGSVPAGRDVWVGPVPGLEVAPEPDQVDRGEVGADPFPDPPLPLSGAGAARPAEPVDEMFPPDPPEEAQGQVGGA